MNKVVFVRLAEQYMDTVYAIAVNNCRNPADADDIVQNTFLKLFRSDNSFETDENAKRWLIRVAINEMHSLFRSPWKRKVSSLDETAGSQDEKKVFSDEERELYDAMHRLPENYRVIIYLFYFEEYTTKEISEILEMSEATVRKRLSRGRQALRKLLEQQ